jgi:hypothetical protein
VIVIVKAVMADEVAALNARKSTRRLVSPETVQKLQTALHAKAKEEPSYRFYALYDKLYREDILAGGQANGGAPCEAVLQGERRAPSDHAAL